MPEVVYLSPKVYIGKTLDNKEVIKAKGLTNTSALHLEDLKSLLIKESQLKLYHDKSHKNYTQGTIMKNSTLYTLSATENKRKHVYNNEGRFVNTQQNSPNYFILEVIISKYKNTLAQPPKVYVLSL